MCQRPPGNWHEMSSFFFSYVCSCDVLLTVLCSVYPFFRQHIVWESRRRVKQRRRRRREGHGGGRGGGGVDSSGGGSGRWWRRECKCKSVFIFTVYFILFNSNHFFRQQFDRGKRRRSRRRGRCDGVDQLQPQMTLHYIDSSVIFVLYETNSPFLLILFP